MREIKLYQGGHPFKNDDLTHMSDGFKDALLAFAQGIDTNKNFILDGGVITTAGPNTLISDGYISLNGEIYKIKAQSITTVSGTLHFYVKQYAVVPDVPSLVVEAPSPSQLVNPNYGQLYQDTLRKDVHVERRVEIKFNAIAGDSATGVIYVAGSVPRLKQVRDALNRAAYKNEENLFTATQSFSKGTLDTVDITIGAETHKQLRLKNDGNTYIYNPGANVIVSRVNLVDNTNANVSSPNIINDNGTELTIHVISGSVRLINYNGHVAGSYTTSGGIFIPPSVGGNEVYVPTGSTISLVRSNDYGSAYEYILKSINSPGFWTTTDSSSLGASPAVTYTKIAEIQFTGINQSAETILDIENDSILPNGSFKTFSYAKVSFKAEIGTNFASNASYELKWIGGLGLYANDFFARLEVKTSGQQIIRLYLRYGNAYCKFKVAKTNIIDKVTCFSLQPLLTALPPAINGITGTQAFLKPAIRGIGILFDTNPGNPTYTNNLFSYGSVLKRILVMPNINNRKVAVSFTVTVFSNWPKNIGSGYGFRLNPYGLFNWTINGSYLTAQDATPYQYHLWPLSGLSGSDGLTGTVTKSFLTPFLDPGSDLQMTINTSTINTNDAPGDFRTQFDIQNIKFFFEDELSIS